MWEVANLLFYKYFTHLTVDFWFACVCVSTINNPFTGFGSGVQLSFVDRHASSHFEHTKSYYFVRFSHINWVLAFWVESLHSSVFLSRMQNCQTVSSRTHHNLINLCLLRTLRSDKYLPGLDLNRHSIQFSYVKFIVSPFCVWIIIWERLSMEIRLNWQRAKMPCNCCGMVENIVMTSSVDCSLFEENGNNIAFYGGLNTNWASIKCVAMWWNMVFSMESKIG